MRLDGLASLRHIPKPFSFIDLISTATIVAKGNFHKANFSGLPT